MGNVHQLVGVSFCIFETMKKIHMTYLYIFIGGGLGSVCRFGISRLFSSVSENFPYGTLLSNILASLILALAIYQMPKTNQEWLPYFLVVGFCGGFSTFSTFSHELVLLMQNGNWLQAMLYLMVSVLAGVGCIWLLSVKA